MKTNPVKITACFFVIAATCFISSCQQIPSAPRYPAATTGTPAQVSSLTPAAQLRCGDEGMWPLHNLPLNHLKEKYGFIPTPGWLKHAQLASARVGNGGSAAFVSPTGLLLTNHHVALSQLQKVSTPQKDYIRDGFYAPTPEQEMRFPDLEVNVLVSTEDVTSRVLSKIDPSASQEQQNRQRKAQIARIEKESTDQTKLRSDVVELYHGGEYWLYRYKKYTDVRLVMAPEMQAAFFGGDLDNFTYPRCCLDFAFFRVYENDKPAHTPDFFRLIASGPKQGDLVFVLGHPGSTERLQTVAQLRSDRDFGLPLRLEMLNRYHQLLYKYAVRGPEQARQVKSRIFGVENSIKNLNGKYQTLTDKSVFERLKAAEESLRRQVRQNPRLEKLAGKSWDRIAQAVEQAQKRYKLHTYQSLRNCRLLDIARNIVRYVAEIEKPNDKRYEEYRDSALESLELELYSPAPIYPELEEYLLAQSLSESLAALGPDNPVVKTALAGRSPAQAAHDLITGTSLVDPAVRRQLVKDGKTAVAQSKDSMIAIALQLDPIWRGQRDWLENTVQSVETSQGNKIARARFEILGRDMYPDATFTLRLSCGTISDYELGTTKVPYKTTFFDLFGRSCDFDNQPPFDLAEQIEKQKANIRMDTALNFISTNDIIGGNSGSPVINKDARYVGLIFDGNIQSLGWAYVYEDKIGRSISVSSAAIIEALRNIYSAPELLSELTEQ